MTIETLAGVGQIVLCVVFYNFLELDWLLSLGWAVFAVAMMLAWRARVALEAKGAAREGESWLHTKKVVATGIYGVVRHPMYLSFLLISLALVFISQHWLNGVLGVVLMGLLYNDMCREEESNLEKFGDDYLRYMRQVPRVNVVVGIVRLVRRRKENEGGV